MIKNIKYIIIGLFFLFLFLIFFRGLEKTNNYSPLNISKKFETNIIAKTLNDKKEVSLKKLIGKKNFSLINIWASWCLPCRDEHSYLIYLKEFKNIKVIGINYKDNQVNANNFLEDYGNPYFEILVDTDGTKSIELGAYGVPESFLVNNETNEIIKKYIGPLDDLKFKEIIKIVKNEKI